MTVGLRVPTLNLLSPRHTFSPRNPLVSAGEMALERGRRIDDGMVRCGVHGPRLDVAGCELALDRPAGELSGGWRWP